MVAKGGKHSLIRLHFLQAQTAEGECGDVLSAWNSPFSGCWFAPNYSVVGENALILHGLLA